MVWLSSKALNTKDPLTPPLDPLIWYHKISKQGLKRTTKPPIMLYAVDVISKLSLWCLLSLIYKISEVIGNRPMGSTGQATNKQHSYNQVFSCSKSYRFWVTIHEQHIWRKEQTNTSLLGCLFLTSNIWKRQRPLEIKEVNKEVSEAQETLCYLNRTNNILCLKALETSLTLLLPLVIRRQDTAQGYNYHFPIPIVQKMC